MDHVGLSTVACPNMSFVVDNIPPRFVSINMTCFTRNNGNFEEQVSWDVQALSGIVTIRYNISNIVLDDPQDFLPFPGPVAPFQLDYNLQPLLQNYSGMVYLTLQAESGVGLTTTNTTRVDLICSDS